MRDNQNVHGQVDVPQRAPQSNAFGPRADLSIVGHHEHIQITIRVNRAVDVGSKQNKSHRVSQFNEASHHGLHLLGRYCPGHIRTRMHTLNKLHWLMGDK